MALESLQNGRYRILRPLGSGSMGEVYLVDDTRINRQVAIKIVRTEASPYPGSQATTEATRLFEREARAIAQLNHPYILPLFDFGEELVNAAPLTFMVMPYCPDGSLNDWLQKRENPAPLTPYEVAHFLRQAADALQFAHDSGILHQDVKPSNFLIRKRQTALPDLLLADFGIAKLTASTSGMSHAIRGTPIYMAPEQWEGNPVPASDQYALAVMIYQLLTGQPPFQGGIGQMMYQHLHTQPSAPSTLNPALTDDIDATLLRALAKKLAERFPTISALADAFEQALLNLDGPTILRTGTGTVTGATNRLPLNRLPGVSAVLAISQAEARYGTSRVLTLPGGRTITVRVPKGTQDGQTLRIEESGPDGLAAEPVLLTISVIAQPPSSGAPIGHSADTVMNDATAFSNRERHNPPADEPTQAYQSGAFKRAEQPPPLFQQHEDASFYSAPTSYHTVERPPPAPSPVPVARPRNPAPPVAQPPPALPQQRRPATRKRTSSGGVIALILLVLLIFVSSAVIYYVVNANQTALNNANGTATAQSNNNNATATQAQLLANGNATNTVQAINSAATANASATAHSQSNSATATAQAEASATAQANASATAQANINATATSVSATATATASVTPTPFTIQSVNVTVSPASISGIACGSNITVTYTTTFVATSNVGGAVQFKYTVDTGNTWTNGSLTFNPGDTTKNFTFTWSGALPPDHSMLGAGQVITTSPNAITSNAIAPSGQCT